MTDKKKYIEVEGIKCEIKNPKKRGTVIAYQESLLSEIDNYIGKVERWTEVKRNYCDGLKISVKTAPFVLGWLKLPENNNDYLFIKGYLTLDELEKNKKPVKKRATKKSIKKSVPTAKKPVTKKAAPKAASRTPKKK